MMIDDAYAGQEWGVPRQVRSTEVLGSPGAVEELEESDQNPERLKHSPIRFNW